MLLDCSGRLLPGQSQRLRRYRAARLVASWFFWPFVILALPQLFCINTIDLYSSGVTLQALGVPLKRWGCVIVDTLICGAVTALVIFKGNFYTDLSGFLDYIVVWLGPWFGILMVDYLLRRAHYDTTSLATKRGGVYWRNGGINWKALVALGLGMFAAMTWIDAAFYFPAYSSFFSNRTHGADFSWLFGLIVGAAAYYVLSASSVRKRDCGRHDDFSRSFFGGRYRLASAVLFPLGVPTRRSCPRRGGRPPEP